MGVSRQPGLRMAVCRVVQRSRPGPGSLGVFSANQHSSQNTGLYYIHPTTFHGRCHRHLIEKNLYYSTVLSPCLHIKRPFSDIKMMVLPRSLGKTWLGLLNSVLPLLTSITTCYYH